MMTMIIMREKRKVNRTTLKWFFFIRFFLLFFCATVRFYFIRIFVCSMEQRIHTHTLTESAFDLTCPMFSATAFCHHLALNNIANAK